MITNFEEITHELTDYEKNHILPLVVEGMKTKLGKNRAVKSGYIIETLRGKYGIKLDGPRFRKVMHVIQVNSLVPGIMATSKGYYVATTKEELESYEESLMQRAESIISKAKGINYQIRQFYGTGQRTVV